MKNILKKTVYIIIILLIIFILLSIFLYFFTRHHLDFQPENKDIDKIIIYGDVRSGYLTHIRIADMIYQEKPDMVIFTGDIASNSRNYIHYMQHTIFEKKLWDNAEYYPVRGNHESTYWLYDAFLICQMICHIILLIEWVCTLLCLIAGMYMLHLKKLSWNGLKMI